MNWLELSSFFANLYGSSYTEPNSSRKPDWLKYLAKTLSESSLFSITSMYFQTSFKNGFNKLKNDCLTSSTNRSLSSSSSCATYSTYA